MFTDYYRYSRLFISLPLMNKRPYIKPEVLRIEVDKSISLQMASQPHDPPPRGGGSKGTDTPFQSPFGDKPFG